MKAMVEDLGLDAESDVPEIPVAGVSSDVVKNLLKFIKAYYDALPKDQADGSDAEAGVGACACAGGSGTRGNITFDFGSCRMIVSRMAVKVVNGTSTFTDPAGPPSHHGFPESSDANGGADATCTATTLPTTMAGLHLFLSPGRKATAPWYSRSGLSAVEKTVEAADFLDMPAIVSAILAVVGAEISKQAAAMGVEVAAQATGKCCTRIYARAHA